MATDAFGEEIQVGDWVSYFSGGKFPTILKGQVVEIRKQVKVRATQIIEGRYNFRSDDQTHWCVPHRLTKTVETFEVDVTDPVNVTINVTDNPDFAREIRDAIQYGQRLNGATYQGILR